MTRNAFFAAGIALTLTLSGRGGEPARPAPPERYDVRIRYQINAFRNERLMQYNEMLRYFEKLGFVKDPGEEDEPENPQTNRMSGRISSKDARRLLGERHVKTLLLLPAAGKLPEDQKALVRVQVEIIRGLPRDRQEALSEKVLKVLTDQGFQEAVGYDTKGSTRLVGLFPAGKLDSLLDNPVKPNAAESESPFATRAPIQVVEAQLNLPPIMPRPEAPAVPKGQEKITPELRNLLSKPEEAAKRVRLEVILAATPDPDDRSWKAMLNDAAPNIVIEGRLGPLVAVLGTANQAPALAALPAVDTVRLPRSGETRLAIATESAEAAQKLLETTGLGRLHNLGHKGKGTKLAVIDGDFRGWEPLVGKKLPKNTQYVDLTASRNADVLPDKFPEGATGTLGNGTVCALAALLAAPEADLTLIRIDPSAPYQLYEVARFINGDVVRSENLEHRAEDLVATGKSLEARRQVIILERQRVFDMFGGDEESKKLRDEFLKKEAKLEADEKAHKEAEIRLLALTRTLTGLKTVRVVACPLVWHEGHPIVGSGPMSRYLDDRPFKAALWLQAAGDAKGQIWEGIYLDTNDNRVMEFAPPTSRLPEDRWTRELNFLGWQPTQGARSADLPANARLRVSIQWREPHDPDFWKNKEDLYRDPLVRPRLVVLRQRDPAGAKLPADDLAVVAQSVGLPQRLDNQPNSAVYEQTVEFNVPEAGRYALRVEFPGGMPTSIRPVGVPTLPALSKAWELRPRIFVETVQGLGRAVLLDYATSTALPGMPGNAQAVITVEEAGSLAARPEGSIPKSPSLRTKPDLLGYDPFAKGTEVSEANDAPVVGFAAGWAATAHSAGAPTIRFQQNLRLGPGALLEFPRDWLPNGR